MRKSVQRAQGRGTRAWAPERLQGAALVSWRGRRTAPPWAGTSEGLLKAARIDAEAIAAAVRALL